MDISLSFEAFFPDKPHYLRVLLLEAGLVWLWFGLGEGRRLSDRVSVCGPGCSGTLRPGQPGRPRWPQAHPPPPPPSAGTKGMCHHHTWLLRVIMNAFVNSLGWTFLPFSCPSCCAFVPPQSACAVTESQASTDHPGIDFFFLFSVLLDKKYTYLIC